MSTRRRRSRQLPGRKARIPAAFCALLMTGCLWAFLLSLLGLQLMTSEGLHERAALAGDVVDLQMRRIRAEVADLGEEYGFDSEGVISLIDRAQVEDLDRRMVQWWTGFMTTGILEEKPSFEIEKLPETLSDDDSFMARAEDAGMASAVESVSRAAGEIVRKSAIQVRDLIVETGVSMARKQVNLPQMMELLRRMPVALGLVSLLTAGLIALLMSRRIQTAGQFIGGAMSAAGLLMMGSLALLRMIGIRGMIAEASAALEAQMVHLSRIMMAETLGLAGMLLLLGGLMMFRAWKEY